MLTTTLPDGRRGQLLAGGLALLVVIAVWLGLVAPVLDWYSDRADRLEALRERAARESALIETLPALRAEANKTAGAPTRQVLTGSTDAIAGATLQEQVQTMASAANAQLTSIETLPGEQNGTYRRIGVRLELSAQLAVVIALLKSVEEAQPSMLVDDIRLTATPVGPLNAQLPLDCAFTVYAFRIGTAKDDSQ
jgi:general secretion pathway protein M